MFNRLKQIWKVDGTQLFLILCVFAITGTTTAFVIKQVTSWLQLESSSAWFWVMKLAVLIFGYQFIIIVVAIPFDQFKFFWNYEKRMPKWFEKLFVSKLL